MIKMKINKLVLLIPIVLILLYNIYEYYKYQNLNKYTNYAKEYSENNFKTITLGMTKNEVLKIMRYPLGRTWVYGINKNFRFVDFKYGEKKVIYSYRLKNIKKGMHETRVLKILGKPIYRIWGYSTGHKKFNVRSLIIKNDIVVEIRNYSKSDY